MASESLTHLLLHHHGWLWHHMGNLHGCRKLLITFRLHPFDLKITLCILCTYNLTFSNTIGFSLANIVFFIFFPIFPSSSRNPNLRIFISVLIENIQNLEKTIDLLQRFTLRIWALQWPLRQPSRRQSPCQNRLLPPLWQLFWLQHYLRLLLWGVWFPLRPLKLHHYDEYIRVHYDIYVHHDIMWFSSMASVVCVSWRANWGSMYTSV